MADIYFISGPCGCGKTSLTDALAKYMVKVEKRRQVYVIHGDDFHQGFVLRAYEEDIYWENGQVADQIRKRIDKRGDTEMVERALFLKEKLENAMENQGHIYDNTGKNIEQETEEIAVLMKNGSLMIKEEE